MNPRTIWLLQADCSTARAGLASGQPVKALVQGDVPVLGTQVACRSCHGRSGMGAIEGGRIPAAIAGPLLFAADAQRRRPAYTDSTLARALREGIDSAGRPIDPLMPRYQLDARDLAALTAYLHQLGAVASPGVTPDSLRIATIIAGDVASDAERAMLDVLKTFVAARNRSGPQRLRGGHFPGQFKETYREWSLEVWRLGGPPETWRAQLDAHYRERPPFALVGGLGSQSVAADPRLLRSRADALRTARHRSAASRRWRRLFAVLLSRCAAGGRDHRRHTRGRGTTCQRRWRSGGQGRLCLPRSRRRTRAGSGKAWWAHARAGCAT